MAPRALVAPAVAALLAASCLAGADEAPDASRSAERLQMVRRQIEARGIGDSRVLDAMRAVPRHLFVPERFRPWAYDDRPLSIGYRQTISQPYIVAFMTEILRPQAEHKVLEIGTGSGYQAAVLSLLVDEVFTIEIVEPLARRAAEDLRRHGYENVSVRAGDGYAGWPEEAPFDGIIVTAAPPYVPEPLVDQLKAGGRMILPVGEGYQELQLLEKTDDGVTVKSVLPVRFVPMTGEVRKRSRKRD